MKKHIPFLFLALLLLFVFACDFQMPEEIRVKGSRTISAGINYSIADEISKAIKDNASFKDGDFTFTILECINLPRSAPITLLIHMDVPDIDFEMPDELQDSLDAVIDEILQDFIDNLDYDALVINPSDTLDMTDPYTFGVIEYVIQSLIDELDNGVEISAGDNIDFGNFEIEIPGTMFTDVQDEIMAELTAASGTITIEQAIEKAVKTAKETMLETELTIISGDNLFKLEETISIELPDYVMVSNFGLDILSKLFILVLDENGNEIEDDDILNIVKLNMDLIIGTNPNKLLDGDLISSKCDIDLTADVYDKRSLPDGGMDINLSSVVSDILDGGNKDLEFVLEALIPAGTTVTLKNLSKALNISAELVIWLPLEIKADGIVEIEIFLEDLFELDPGDDLFGRDAYEDLELTEYIESLSISVRFNQTVFNKVSLKIENGAPVTFEKEFIFSSGRTANISFTKDDLDELNSPDNFPFIPKLTLAIGDGGELTIPQNFKIERVSVSAKINTLLEI